MEASRGPRSMRVAQARRNQGLEGLEDLEDLESWESRYRRAVSCRAAVPDSVYLAAETRRDASGGVEGEQVCHSGVTAGRGGGRCDQGGKEQGRQLQAVAGKASASRRTCANAQACAGPGRRDRGVLT